MSKISKLLESSERASIKSKKIIKEEDDYNMDNPEDMDTPEVEVPEFDVEDLKDSAGDEWMSLLASPIEDWLNQPENADVWVDGHIDIDVLKEKLKQLFKHNDVPEFDGDVVGDSVITIDSPEVSEEDEDCEPAKIYSLSVSYDGDEVEVDDASIGIGDDVEDIEPAEDDDSEAFNVGHCPDFDEGYESDGTDLQNPEDTSIDPEDYDYDNGGEDSGFEDDIGDSEGPLDGEDSDVNPDSDFDYQGTGEEVSDYPETSDEDPDVNPNSDFDFQGTGEQLDDIGDDEGNHEEDYPGEKVDGTTDLPDVTDDEAEKNVNI